LDLTLFGYRFKRHAVFPSSIPTRGGAISPLSTTPQLMHYSATESTTWTMTLNYYQKQASAMQVLRLAFGLVIIALMKKRSFSLVHFYSVTWTAFIRIKGGCLLLVKLRLVFANVGTRRDFYEYICMA